MPAQTELVDVYTRDKNWIYFGGGFHTTIHDRDVRNHYNHFKIRWKDFFKNQPYIGHEDRCKCNTKILQQCYILNTKSKEIVVLGNCCIRRFGLNGRTCSMCNAVHKNTSDNYCKECRIINKKKQQLIERRIKGLCECGKKKKYKWAPECMSCWQKNQ